MAACPPSKRARARRIRIRRIRLTALLVVLAAIAVVLGYQSLASSSSSAASPFDSPRSDHRACTRRSAARHAVAGTWPSGCPDRRGSGSGRPEPASGCDRKRREGDDGLPRAPRPSAPARSGRPGDHSHGRRRRRHRPPSRTAGVGRDHCCGRRDDRAAGAAGAAGAVGEQHRRSSGALELRLHGAVRCPDECHRTVAGNDPNPLHRSERLRRRNRLDCRRPDAHRRSGDAAAGVRGRSSPRRA